MAKTQPEAILSKRVINTIQTQNYKKIGKNGIRLDELVGVNYFVGENSSGKTSLLRYIFEFNRAESLWVTDGITDLDHLQEFDLKKTAFKPTRNLVKQLFLDSIVNYNYLSLDLLAFSILEAKKGYKWKILDEGLYKEALKIGQERGVVSNKLQVADNGAVREMDGEELNSGAQKIINLIYAVLWAYKMRGCVYFMFDNPDNNLHPSWQKHLPGIFEFLSSELAIQIFVATHSPFIVSAAGLLGEAADKPTQKVYFMVNGSIASKRGVPSAKGNKGYWGTRVADISSKMLGVGLIDLVSRQLVVHSKDSPVLVLCEGEGENADARIYNIIFRNRIPSVLFVSSRGSSQLYKSFTILNQIKPGLSTDFEIRMLRDRDHEFPTEQSVTEFESSNPYSKVLRKRAIEAYIFNPDTAKLVLSLFNKKLLKKDVVAFAALEQKLSVGVHRAIPGDGYKQELQDWFITATRGYLRELMRGSQYTLMERIAYLIYPGHPVYQELEAIIFG